MKEITLFWHKHPQTELGTGIRRGCSYLMNLSLSLLPPPPPPCLSFLFLLFLYLCRSSLVSLRLHPHVVRYPIGLWVAVWAALRQKSCRHVRGASGGFLCLGAVATPAPSPTWRRAASNRTTERLRSRACDQPPTRQTQSPGPDGLIFALILPCLMTSDLKWLTGWMKEDTCRLLILAMFCKPMCSQMEGVEYGQPLEKKLGFVKCEGPLTPS